MQLFLNNSDKLSKCKGCWKVKAMYYIIFVYMHVLFFIYSVVDLHICVYEKRRYRTLVMYIGNMMIHQWMECGVPLNFQSNPCRPSNHNQMGSG